MIPQAVPYGVKVPVPFPVKVEIPKYKEIEVKKTIYVKVPIYEHIPIYHHFALRSKEPKKVEQEDGDCNKESTDELKGEFEKFMKNNNES